MRCRIHGLVVLRKLPPSQLATEQLEGTAVEESPIQGFPFSRMTYMSPCLRGIRDFYRVLQRMVWEGKHPVIDPKSTFNLSIARG